VGHAIAALKESSPAVLAQLRRLGRHGLIAEPVRGFRVIVPPEYGGLGCLPAEQFIDPLMRFLEEPSYLCLLTAAERLGAAHQRPQSTQVMVRRNRQPIACGQVRVVFVARDDVEKMPVKKFNTPRGLVRCSTPEVTALELMGYPRHAGGLNNAATVLSELAEEMDAATLLDVARLCPVSWSQRLGYLLELVGNAELARPLIPFVRDHARSHARLRRAAKAAGGKAISRWKLIVNTNVEIDT
jgi:predicted transcriptional regulator of viral defense system